MAANFPTSLDVEAGVGGSATPVPDTTDQTDTPSHAALHQKEGDAIVAVETKVGTGASTAAANQVLTGTGSGTSAWGTVALAMMSANSVDSDQYVDGSIDAAHFAAGAVDDAAMGSAWTTYSPSWTNLTVGNGTATYRYTQIGTTVHAAGEFIWGSTTSISSANVKIDLPVAYANAIGVAAVHYYDSSANVHYSGVANLGATDIMKFVGATAAIGATVPFTWATSDAIRWSITYEAASA